MADPLPLYLSVDGVYNAKELTLPWADALGEGVVLGGAPAGLDPMKVAPLSPAGMGVEIAAGAAWVKNDRTTDAEAYYEGGLWRVTRLSSFQLPIVAADPTNPRVDRVGLEVLDKQFGAASDLGRYRAVAGTPAASPSAPAEPRSFLTLGLVTVPAAAASIAAGNIADARAFGGSGRNPGTLVKIADTGFLAADAANVDWPAIPQVYSALLLVWSARSTGAVASTNLNVLINGGVTAYDLQFVTGAAGSTTAQEALNQASGVLGAIPGSTATANRHGTGYALLPGYAGLVNTKSLVATSGRNQSAASGDNPVMTRYTHVRNTAALVQLTLTPATGNFLAGSRLTLYGLR